MRNFCAWFRRPKFAAREDKYRDGVRYDAYLALKLQHDGAVWFTARGCSMLSVFAPWEKVRVVALQGNIALGQVVAFSQGAKLTAHRIVGRRADDQGWITKGDTLVQFDGPLPDTAIIGQVTAVKGWRGHRKVTPDAHTARLSAGLAGRFNGFREQRPAIMRFILYTLTFWMLFPLRRRPVIREFMRKMPFAH